MSVVSASALWLSVESYLILGIQLVRDSKLFFAFYADYHPSSSMPVYGKQSFWAVALRSHLTAKLVPLSWFHNDVG